MYFNEKNRDTFIATGKDLKRTTPDFHTITK